MKIFKKRQLDGESMDLHSSSASLDDEYGTIAFRRSVDTSVSGEEATLYGLNDFKIAPNAGKGHMTVNGTVERLGFSDRTSSVEVTGGSSCKATFYQHRLEDMNNIRGKNDYMTCNSDCECWNENGNEADYSNRGNEYGTCEEIRDVNIPGGNLEDFGNKISAVDVDDGCSVTLYKQRDHDGLKAELTALSRNLALGEGTDSVCIDTDDSDCTLYE